MVKCTLIQCEIFSVLLINCWYRKENYFYELFLVYKYLVAWIYIYNFYCSLTGVYWNYLAMTVVSFLSTPYYLEKPISSLILIYPLSIGYWSVWELSKVNITDKPAVIHLRSSRSTRTLALRNVLMLLNQETSANINNPAPTNNIQTTLKITCCR